MNSPEDQDTISFEHFVVSLPKGAADADELRRLIDAALGTHAIVLRNEAVAAGTGRPLKSYRRHELAEAVRTIMADGQVWLASDLGALLQRQHLAGVLAELTRQGTISRVARGQYMLADAAAAQPPVPRTRLAGLALDVFQAVESPLTLAALAARLGRPRREISNVLARLLRRGLVDRSPEGQDGRIVFAYVQHGKSPEDAVGAGENRLPPFAAAVLSAIPERGAARLSDVYRMTARPSSAPTVVMRLTKMGLVTLEGSLNRRVVALTEAGRQHPQYDAEVEKAPRLANLGAEIELAAGVLALVDCTREFRASELILLRNETFRGLRFDYPIWRLVKRNFAERVEATRGRARAYRLTAQGRDYVNALRAEGIVPSPADMKTFLAAFFATPRREAEGGNLRSGALAAEPCRQAILEIARREGSVTAKHAARSLGGRAPALSVIYGHLRTLEARGLVEPVRGTGGGRAHLAWRLSGAREESEHPG